MRTRMLVLVTLFVMFSNLPAFGQRTGVTKIIAQPESPVEITQYDAQFEPETASAYNRHLDQIRHSVKILNRSGKELMAVEVGLVSFNLFNEYLGRLHGIGESDMPKPNDPKPRSWSWTHSPYGCFSFLTGVAYVSQIRFRDGTIWKADMNSIVTELKKIEADFDGSVLNKKKPVD